MLIQYRLFDFNINIGLSRNRRRNHIVILNYHQIAARFDKKYHALWTFTDAALFEQQMVWLKRRYKIISLRQAIQITNDNAIKDNYACLTFDDGDKSIIDAMAILEKYNLPATFFINSGYLDNQASCWINIYRYIRHCEKYQSLLTAEITQHATQLRDTADKKLYRQYSRQIEQLFPIIQDDFAGVVGLADLKNINTELFDIGAHGFEHQRFSMMSAAWQQNNIAQDIAVLSELESYQPIFAIPFGRPADWTLDTINICKTLGLEIMFADGNVNCDKNIGYNRIPADNTQLKNLLYKPISPPPPPPPRT